MGSYEAENERSGQLPAIMLSVLVLFPEAEGSCAHAAKTTLTISWANCPTAERAGANLVFTSHQLKCGLVFFGGGEDLE